MTRFTINFVLFDVSTFREYDEWKYVLTKGNIADVVTNSSIRVQQF